MENHLGVIQEDHRITLSWSGVNVTFSPTAGMIDRMLGRPSPPGRRILQNVSGVARPGRLLALMGASGAGKTTLLNTLTNRGNSKQLQVGGSILINGTPMSQLGETAGELVGYVQQNDILPPTLTVREYLTFSATMTMFKRLTAQQIKDEVDKLLVQFSMLECADTLIDVGPHRISGSERKRLSVACKLFGERRLLFLDEPTTGLDSFVAQLLVENLRALAELGYNVICTIHQPSSQVFELFDDLFLLANGRTAYFGELRNAVGYFSELGYKCPDTFSPADYLIQTLAVVPGEEEACHDRLQMIVTAFERSAQADAIHNRIDAESSRVLAKEDILLEDASRNRKQAPWVNQFTYLFWRCVIGLWRYPTVIVIRFVLIACACVLLMVIYVHPKDTYTETRANGVQGLLFFMSSFFIIFNSLVIFSVLPQDLPLVIREHRDGLYHLSSYYLTTFLVQSMVGSVFMIGSVSSIYFITGLKREPYTFLITVGILIVIFLVNVAFAALVSSIFETTEDTVSNAVPLVFLSNVLGGYFCILRSIPRYLDPIMFINWLPWGYEMLSINQWSGINDIECVRGNACPRTGDDVLYRWGLNKDAFTKDLILVLVQLAGYHMVTFTILLLKMKFKWSG